MILHKLEHSGSHAFPDHIRVVFRELPALLAVHGPNGAGKTTLFDLIAGALYLTMPYRPGPLHRQFATKGTIKLSWQTEDRKGLWISQVLVDPEIERTEASLLLDGELVAGPLVKDYRRKVEELLGPLELFLSAAYAVQNGAGAFLRLARADRKALLVDLLGLQAYPRYESLTRERGRRVDNDLSLLRARIRDLEASATQKTDLEGRVVVLGERLERAKDRHVAAQAAVQEALAIKARVKEAQAALEPLRGELRRLLDALGEATQAKAGAEARLHEDAGILGEAAAIAAAVRQDGELLLEVEDLDRQIVKVRDAYQRSLELVSQAQTTRAQVERNMALAEAELGPLERAAATVALVPCKGQGAYADCRFLTDAHKAAAAVPGIRTALDLAKRTLEALPIPAIPADPALELLKTKGERSAIRRQLAPKAGRLSTLRAAEARKEQLDERIRTTAEKIDELTGRRQELEAQLATAPELDEQLRVAQQGANSAEHQAHDANKEVLALERDLGQVEGQLRTVQKAAEDLEAAWRLVDPAAEDLADWTLLTKAFGASGIPALLIDQALPEIGRLATDLLRECYGEAVFTIALTTQKESAAGDRLLETLDVVVRRGGDPLDAALLSGGESVLVSEALSLAIALFQASRGGRRIRTLLRDEVSAPLDVDRAPAYARMLRRAVQLGGFTHVLFVSHQPACLELADARLEVRGGKVTVQ